MLRIQPRSAAVDASDNLGMHRATSSRSLEEKLAESIVVGARQQILRREQTISTASPPEARRRRGSGGVSCDSRPAPCHSQSARPPSVASIGYRSKRADDHCGRGRAGGLLCGHHRRRSRGARHVAGKECGVSEQGADLRRRPLQRDACVFRGAGVRHRLSPRRTGIDRPVPPISSQRHSRVVRDTRGQAKG